jgi:protein-tyrosine-phosphatase
MIPPTHDSEPDPASRKQSSEENSGQPFRLLFVCTGNTCRSPIAAALAREEVERRGWRDMEISSAGVAAVAGGPASEGTQNVGVRHGLELVGHRSRPLTPYAVEEADLILTMSVAHLDAVRSLGGGDRASLITAFAEGREGDPEWRGGGVPDPFGGDDAAYETTYRALKTLVRQVLDRLAPVVSP